MFYDKDLYRVATSIAQNSKDPNTKVGAVIGHPGVGRVLAWGWNRLPDRIAETPERMADRDAKLACVIHAEMDAILRAAGRNLDHPVTLYVHPPGPWPSCARCTAHIIQAGIRRVAHVYEEWDEATFGDWRLEAHRYTLQMYREAGVEVVHL